MYYCVLQFRTMNKAFDVLQNYKARMCRVTTQYIEQVMYLTTMIHVLIEFKINGTAMFEYSALSSSLMYKFDLRRVNH